MKARATYPTCLILLLLIACTTLNAQLPSYAYLDTNRAKAILWTNGFLWGQPVVVNGQAEVGSGYFFPEVLPKPILPEGGSLFISTASNGNRAAAIAANYNQSHFLPGLWGPEDPGDQMWTVFQNALVRHSQLTHQYNGQIPAQFIPKGILTWPAKDNPFSLASDGQPATYDVAEFVDVNQDGKYNPVEGDYPKILGDQQVSYSFKTDSSLGLPPISIWVEAYANNPNSVPNGVTWYRLSLTNHGPMLDTALVGMWFNSYRYAVGTDTSTHALYWYKPGQSHPYGYLMHGLSILESPTGKSDFSFFNWSGLPGTSGQLGHFFNNQIGRYTRTGPQGVGGPEQDPCAQFIFRFTGIGSGPFIWDKDESITLHFAVISTVCNEEAVKGCPDKSCVTRAHAEVSDQFWQLTSSPISDKPLAIQVYPNPANDHIRMQGVPPTAGQLAICDMQGKVWVQRTIAGTERLHVGRLPSGMYLIRYTNKEGVWHGTFVKL